MVGLDGNLAKNMDSGARDSRREGATTHPNSMLLLPISVTPSSEETGLNPRDNAVGGCAGCPVHPIPGSWFGFSLTTTKLSVPPRSVNCARLIRER